MAIQKHLAVTIIACLPILVFAQDPSIDRMIASQCSQCHGTDGYATGDIDEIAGEELQELYEELLEMKEDRPDDLMDHQAWGYTDEQLYRIARYYSTLPESGDDCESEHDHDSESESDDDCDSDHESESESH